MANNFYDKTETYPLTVNELTIDGELSDSGKADFSTLPVHSVIVKETLLDDSGSDKFIGAYRYDGYSLFDILNSRIPYKINASEFNSIIDLFVEIENEKGEKAIFSWGEIYYPNNLQKGILCIAATDGYRCAASCSEIFNRNDQQEFLLVQTGPGEEGGAFRLFVASDFFSDRAVKSISEIHLEYQTPVNLYRQPCVQRECH